MDSKECLKCRNVKPVSDFNPSERGLGGYRSRCKACISEEKATLYAKTEKRVRAAIKLEKIEILTKVCRACDREKPKCEFYKSSQNVDGFRTICKECSKLERRVRHKKNPEIANGQATQWRKNNREQWLAYQRGWKQENSLKPHIKIQRQSQGAVGYEIKKGALKQEPCIICNKLPTHAHHVSYDPRHKLWIQWLCPYHHSQANAMKTKFKFFSKQALTYRP